MMTVHFTIPTRFGGQDREQHPVVPEATPDDWFDVEVPHFSQNAGAAENQARLFVNRVYGDQGWMSTYVEGNSNWDAIKAKYYPGCCVATLTMEGPE